MGEGRRGGRGERGEERATYLTRSLSLQQLDIKNAFLNGELEEVYMDVPPGCTEKFGTTEVCELKKSLYGLKQSPRAWFGRFATFVLSLGYSQCQSVILYLSKEHLKIYLPS